MKIKPTLVLLSLIMLFGCSTSRQAGVDKSIFLGNWTAYSTCHMAICGDMVVGPNKIKFGLKGSVDFEVLKHDEEEYILKISRDVNSGYFMRLGPIAPSKYSEDLEMEVAFYQSKEKAFAERVDRVGEASCWGLYTKEKLQKP